MNRLKNSLKTMLSVMRNIDFPFYFKDDYTFFQKFSPVFAIIGPIMHFLFYISIHNLTSYYESILLRTTVSIFFLTLLFIPQGNPVHFFSRYYYELILALTFPIFFQIMLYENHFNQYWSLSMMFAAIVYGLTTHPPKALILYPVSVGITLSILTRIDHSTLNISEAVAIQIPAFFSVFCLGIVQTIIRKAYSIVELKRIEIEKEKNNLFIKNEIIEKDLIMARKIQLQLIPSERPNPSIAFFYQPMGQVGGDFFDFIRFRNPELIGIFISDVSGHGVPAAFITSMVKTILIQNAHKGISPSSLLKILNENLRSQTAGNFITAFYGIYNMVSRELVFSNAGHNPPYLIYDNDVNQLHSSNTGFPLAIFSNEVLAKKNRHYQDITIVIKRKTKLLFYTDGLTEATSAKNKKYNAEGQRLDFENCLLKKVLIDHAQDSVDKFVSELKNRLDEFHGSDEYEDDVCAICLDIP
jgi:serine phosphatase RsbU (regulator of sigma subunit)